MKKIIPLFFLVFCISCGSKNATLKKTYEEHDHPQDQSLLEQVADADGDSIPDQLELPGRKYSFDYPRLKIQEVLHQTKFSYNGDDVAKFNTTQGPYTHKYLQRVNALLHFIGGGNHRFEGQLIQDNSADFFEKAMANFEKVSRGETQAIMDVVAKFSLELPPLYRLEPQIGLFIYSWDPLKKLGDEVTGKVAVQLPSSDQLASSLEKTSLHSLEAKFSFNFGEINNFKTHVQKRNFLAAEVDDFVYTDYLGKPLSWKEVYTHLEDSYARVIVTDQDETRVHYVPAGVVLKDFILDIDSGAAFDSQDGLLSLFEKRNEHSANSINMAEKFWRVSPIEISFNQVLEAKKNYFLSYHSAADEEQLLPRDQLIKSLQLNSASQPSEKISLSAHDEGSLLQLLVQGSTSAPRVGVEIIDSSYRFDTEEKRGTVTYSCKITNYSVAGSDDTALKFSSALGPLLVKDSQGNSYTPYSLVPLKNDTLALASYKITPEMVREGGVYLEVKRPARKTTPIGSRTDCQNRSSDQGEADITPKIYVNVSALRIIASQKI